MMEEKEIRLQKEEVGVKQGRSHEPRNTSGFRKLEEVRKGFSPRASLTP